MLNNANNYICVLGFFLILKLVEQYATDNVFKHDCQG